MICPVCKKREKQKHWNAKYCLECARLLRRRPKSTLTKDQIREAKKLIGKMDRNEIAKEMGVSLSSLKRAFPGKRLAFHNKYVLNPGLTKRVCKYYEKHGKKKTQEAFPQVCVRSIVEKYKKLYKPRQIRWTDEQIVQLARMAGIVSWSDQAKFFNRPGAHEGSIRSVWVKKFRNNGGSVNGMGHNTAKFVVKNSCPRIETKFWAQRKRSGVYGRKLCLWVDMRNHLRPEIPKYMKDAIETLAKFQEWLFYPENPKSAILKMARGQLPIQLCK